MPWLGKVPEHWTVLPNRALFAEIRDRNHPDEQMLSVTITKGVVKQTDLLADSSKKDSSNLDRSAYKLVQPRDIAYNKMRAWQGAIGVSDYRGIVSPAYIVMRLRGTANPRYFHHLYRTPQFAKEAERWSYGITSDMWSLRPEHFRLIYSLLPPKDEQDSIIRFIEHADRRIRSYIRVKQRLIELLKQQTQSVIHRVVTRGLDPSVELRPSGVDWLGNIPKHWQIKRLKWVVRLQRGYDLPEDKRIPGEFPVVSSGGVIGTHHQARSKAPGVVIGRYGSTDAVFFIETDFWPHNTSLFVTNFHGNDAKWSYYLLRTVSKADYAGKSAVPGVDRKDLFEIIVAEPPVQEQTNVANWLDARLDGLKKTTAQMNRQIELAREFLARLIADVVTGKLDVRAASNNISEKVLEPVAQPELGEIEEENQKIIGAEQAEA